MRPAITHLLLALIVFLLAIGIFLVVDSYSRMTSAIAENTETLKQIGNYLQRNPANFGAPVNYSVARTLENFANAEFLPSDARRGGTRVSAISAVPGNFNSLILSEQIASAIWSTCNDSLAERNLERVMEWQPKLAESWEVSADGLVYIIKLRRNALWHPYADPLTKQKIPAKPVTADDLIFFWECLQNPDIPCDSLRNYYAQIKSITALDDYTLRVEWKEAYSLSKVFTLGLSPLPRHYFRPIDEPMTDKQFADYLKTTPRNMFVVGCGAYRLAEYKPNDALIFQVFDDYYGVKPSIEKLIWRVIAEPNIQLVEFEKGALDDLGLMPEQWEKETPAPRYFVVTPNIENAENAAIDWEKQKAAHTAPTNQHGEKYQYEPSSTSWTYIGWNLQNPLFTDKKVRQALTMLIDRDRILREVYLGFGRLCDGPFIKNSPYADPQFSGRTFDPIAAKKQLAEAGWIDRDGDGILDNLVDGKPRKFSFTLIYNSTNPLRRQIATIMQAEMKKIGIDMQINSLDWSVVLQKLDSKSFDACVMGWTGVLESDPYQIWHSSQAAINGGSNFIGFSNADADKLIEAGRREMDAEKRVAIYREFYRLVADEQPYSFLLSNVVLIALKKNIRNARIYKLGMSDYHQWME